MRKFENSWELGNFSTPRVFLTLLLVLGGFLLGNLPLILLYPNKGEVTMMDLAAYFGFTALFVLQMIPFFVGIIAFFISVKFVHKTSWLTWITAREKIEVPRLFFAFGLWALLIIIPTLIDWLLFPNKYEVQTVNFEFIKAFLLLLIGLPVQVFFEELLFRSLIFQGIFKRTNSAFLAILLSGVMFGMMHLENPEVTAHGYGLLAIYITLGVFISLMTYLDQGIEVAFGFHLANNFITGLLVTSSEQAFQMPALLKMESLEVNTASFMTLVCSLLLFFILCFRRFHWKQMFIKSK